MSTLVLSDLHLGMAGDRDVLRRDAPALETLLDAVRRADRVVLLGDVVELLEGRPLAAMEAAKPVLREIGRAAGPGTEVVVVPGNHDFAAVRAWLAARAQRGRRVGLSARVGRESTPWLAAIFHGLRPARVQVRYPGVWLADGVYATHGHYLDRHLTPDLVRRMVRPRFARVVGDVPDPATPEDYERAGGANFAALAALLASELPGSMGDTIDRLAGHVRRAGLLAVPEPSILAQFGLTPERTRTMAVGLRRAGLIAMGEVVARLRIDATHVVFGHTHRAGPFEDDDRAEWTTRTGVRLVNTGTWVHDPLLLAGAGPEHPWWPGRAVEVEERGVPRLRSLLGADAVPDVAPVASQVGPPGR